MLSEILSWWVCSLGGFLPVNVITPVLHQASVEGCSEEWAELAVWSWRCLGWSERREDSMYVCALIETRKLCSKHEVVHHVNYSQGLLWAVACFFATISVRGWRGSAVRWADHGGIAECCTAPVLTSPSSIPVLMFWLPSVRVVPILNTSEKDLQILSLYEGSEGQNWLHNVAYLPVIRKVLIWPLSLFLRRIKFQET